METTSVSGLDYDAVHFSHKVDRLSLTGNAGTRRLMFLPAGGRSPAPGLPNPNPDGRDPTGFSNLPGSKKGKW